MHTANTRAPPLPTLPHRRSTPPRLASKVAAVNSTLLQLADLEHAKERLLFTGVNMVGSAADEVDKAKAAAVAAAKTALANSGNKTDLVAAVNATLAFKAGAEGTGLTMVALPTSFQAATAAASGGGGDITCYETKPRASWLAGRRVAPSPAGPRPRPPSSR